MHALNINVKRARETSFNFAGPESCRGPGDLSIACCSRGTNNDDMHVRTKFKEILTCDAPALRILPPAIAHGNDVNEQHPTESGGGWPDEFRSSSHTNLCALNCVYTK